MKKKKLRMLFVRKERVLSQKTERSDDLYGLAKIMEFTAKNVWIQRHLHGKKSESGKECLESVIAVGKMP